MSVSCRHLSILVSGGGVTSEVSSPSGSMKLSMTIQYLSSCVTSSSRILLIVEEAAVRLYDAEFTAPHFDHRVSYK